VAEVGDFRCFADARRLMTYLGLAPSKHSSGASVRRGGITKVAMRWRDGC
jgi:transposase